MFTLALGVPESLDHKLQARAAEQGRDIANVALELVERGLHESVPTKIAHELTPEERLQAFREHMEEVERRPRVNVVIDDSRESIYEGRGE